MVRRPRKLWWTDKDNTDDDDDDDGSANAQENDNDNAVDDEDDGIDDDNFTMMIIYSLKHLEWLFESSLSSFSQKWDYFTHNFKIYRIFSIRANCFPELFRLTFLRSESKRTFVKIVIICKSMAHLIITGAMTDSVYCCSIRRNLSVVVDVSCDPNSPYNPLPFYNSATTFDQPCERVKLFK